MKHECFLVDCCIGENSTLNILLCQGLPAGSSEIPNISLVFKSIFPVVMINALK